jgi:ribonuclease P protein component
MLPKINRIKKKKDFEAIFKNSKSFRDNLFVLKSAKNNLGISRFGFVVSQKISKKATVRNKVRRRMSEAVRADIKNAKTGIDAVFIALSGVEKRKFSEIKKAINGALVKLKIINTPN